MFAAGADGFGGMAAVGTKGKIRTNGPGTVDAQVDGRMAHGKAIGFGRLFGRHLNWDSVFFQSGFKEF